MDAISYQKVESIFNTVLKEKPQNLKQFIQETD